MQTDTNNAGLQPSLASLRDGLLSRAGSQRDEAKMQVPACMQDLNPGPLPGVPVISP